MTDVNLQQSIDEACLSMQETFKPQTFKITGFFSEAENHLQMEARCMDNENSIGAHLRMFFEFFTFLNVDIPDVKYRMEMFTYSDPAFQTGKHHYILECKKNLIPDTGEVMREEWEEFITGLIYIRDGENAQMPQPGPFFDDPPTVYNQIKLTQDTQQEIKGREF